MTTRHILYMVSTIFVWESNRMIFYKTLFARMGNIKEGKLYDPENLEDLSSVEVTLDSLGIKLRDSGDEFRNFGSVLDEVAGDWSNYGSVTQRALAVAFSGKLMLEYIVIYRYSQLKYKYQW